MGNRYLKVPDKHAAANLTAKSGISNHAVAGIPFRVLTTFGHSRIVSDKPQTMSGLSGVPNGTSSQTI